MIEFQFLPSIYVGKKCREPYKRTATTLHIHMELCCWLVDWKQHRKKHTQHSRYARKTAELLGFEIAQAVRAVERCTLRSIVHSLTSEFIYRAWFVERRCVFFFISSSVSFEAKECKRKSACEEFRRAYILQQNSMDLYSVVVFIYLCLSGLFSVLSMAIKSAEFRKGFWIIGRNPHSWNNRLT